MSFPSNPTNGQTANVNGITYEYTSSNNTWTRLLTNPDVFIANSILFAIFFSTFLIIPQIKTLLSII